MAKTNSWIGSPVKRLEDLRFTRGQGQYVGDLVRPRMIHAVILRSPFAHGKIVKLAVGAAAAMPDVVGIVTAADIGEVPEIPLRMEPLPELARFVQPVIAIDKVRYAGEPIAIVLAKSIPAAEDAVAAIDLEIEALQPLVDARTASAGDCYLFEQRDAVEHLGRRECCLSQGGLREIRGFSCAQAYRKPDGAQRIARRMER